MKAIKVFTTTIITTAIFALIVAFGANADASRADRKKKCKCVCKCAIIQQENN